MTASSPRSAATKTVSISTVASGPIGKSSVYNADQQVRYLQLHAETETLLLELQAAIQQQRDRVTVAH